MISVPGKIFIFGEYGVMHGGEAILAAVKPEFECSWSNSYKVHADSPAGRFLSYNKTASFTKVDLGLGAGFGSSTAELISANEYLETPWTEKGLWNWYRTNFTPASGADLVVQNLSRREGLGFYHFQIHSPDYRIHKIEVPVTFLSNCFLFQSPATQKIPTYSDLENRKESRVDISIAHSYIHRWLSTFNPHLLSEWADYLAKLDFESLFAHQVRKDFSNITGVTGVKGCGAGLNDVFLVCINQDFPVKTLREISVIAEKYRLQPLGSLREHA